MKPTNKIILAIAGSDPSGGAGIQADLKTFTVLGVYGGAVITCLTAQNTTGVYSYQPVDSGLVKKQIGLILDDMAVSHIKIGMVGTAEVAESIGEALVDYAGEVIYDPVLYASTGQPLMDAAGLTALNDHIVSKATVITPNIAELVMLAHKKAASCKLVHEAASELFDRFTKLRVLIVKGGHQDIHENLITDYLAMREKPGRAGQPDRTTVLSESHPRITTDNNHGTGCTFASAFAAFHFLTGDDVTAFRKSISFMDELLTLSSSYRLGHGHGPLIHHLIIERQYNI